VVIMLFDAATILAASICQNSKQRYLVFLVERQHPVVQQVCRGDRGLRRIQPSESDLHVGVDEGLLVDPAHAFVLPT
jgi:hypothetical protein